MSVRRAGDIVLAHGHYTVRGFYDSGKDIGSHTRFTSGWTRRAGHWQALFHHATRIEEG
jgi:ketosteroid isomerase-like protein